MHFTTIVPSIIIYLGYLLCPLEHVYISPICQRLREGKVHATKMESKLKPQKDETLCSNCIH